MRALAAALVLAFPLAASAAGPALSEMTSGRYEVALDGMLCHTCARLVAEEVAALPQVDKASVDFEHETLLITIRPQKKLSLSRLRRALKRAAKRVDLGTTFTVKSVVYKVT